MIWQESVSPSSSSSSSAAIKDEFNNISSDSSFINGPNYDIFIKTSNNEGQHFTKYAINLSNNHGISECPSIALLDNDKAIVVWEDSTPGNMTYFTRGYS